MITGGAQYDWCLGLGGGLVRHWPLRWSVKIYKLGSASHPVCLCLSVWSTTNVARGAGSRRVVDRPTFGRLNLLILTFTPVSKFAGVERCSSSSCENRRMNEAETSLLRPFSAVSLYWSRVCRLIATMPCSFHDDSVAAVKKE